MARYGRLRLVSIEEGRIPQPLSCGSHSLDDGVHGGTLCHGANVLRVWAALITMVGSADDDRRNAQSQLRERRAAVTSPRFGFGNSR